MAYFAGLNEEKWI